MTTRRILPGLALLALTLLVCAGSAWAANVSASKAKKTTAPVITKITPLRAKIGDKLTITGKNFVPGKGKTRVFFLRVGGGAAWVRSDSGTRTKVVVHIPATLQKLLPVDGHATRFQIRVLGKRFGSPSKAAKSPLISGPAGANGGGSAGPASVVGPTTGVGGCTPNFTDASVDSDGDLLPDVEEHRIGTDPCAKDTDGDGVEDGYEYYASKDLNSNALPYPWKMPYPNALNPDATVDHDGDGLTNGDEFALWIKYGGHTLPLNYSDGKQTTVPTPAPNPVTQPQLNWSLDDGDGQLDDGERDADGDGLSNFDEARGPMSGPDWWKSQYKLEKPYPVAFAGTNMMDPDTDGDGVLDGYDDNDFDGYSNMFEVHRPWLWPDTYVSAGYTLPPGYANGHNWTAPAGIGLTGTLTNPTALGNTPDPYARVNPFNPCKPLWSPVCHEHPPFDYYGASEDWAAPTQAQVIAAGASAPGPIP
jgi:hypothetical protein